MVARVEERPSELASCLMAARLVLSEGHCKEQWRVRQLALFFFFFEGICGEHRKRQRLQAQEDRASNRRLAGPCLCLLDFRWWEGLAVQWLVALQGGRCTRLEESDGR